MGTDRLDISFTSFALGHVTESFEQEIVCSVKICNSIKTEGEMGHCPIKSQEDCPTDAGFEFASLSSSEDFEQVVEFSDVIDQLMQNSDNEDPFSQGPVGFGGGFFG